MAGGAAGRRLGWMVSRRLRRRGEGRGGERVHRGGRRGEEQNSSSTTLVCSLSFVVLETDRR